MSFDNFGVKSMEYISNNVKIRHFTFYLSTAQFFTEICQIILYFFFQYKILFLLQLYLLLKKILCFVVFSTP